MTKDYPSSRFKLKIGTRASERRRLGIDRRGTAS